MASATEFAHAEVTSGPSVGDAVAPLKVFDATGDHEGDRLDYASERKDKPTVYVFVQAKNWSRPMARFLRKIDEAAGKADAYVVAVWLTSDAEKSREYLPRAQSSLKLTNTALTVFEGDPTAGPNNWGINDRAFCTVAVANNAKVAACHAFVSINETDAPKIDKALKSATEKK